MNNVILMGRLTRDPDMKDTTSNNRMAVFTLAVDRRRNQNGEKEADFIRCVAYGKTAETIERYVGKGRQIVVRGRIQTGNYTNKKGDTVYTTDVIVEHLEFADSRSGTAQQSGQQPAQQQGYAGAPAQQNYQQPQNGYNQQPRQGGYQQPQQQGGYSQQAPRPQQGGYQQPTQNGYNQQPPQPQQPQGGYGYNDLNDFMNLPGGIDEELPFN